MKSFWIGIFLFNYYSEKSSNLLSEEYFKFIPKEDKDNNV